MRWTSAIIAAQSQLERGEGNNETGGAPQYLKCFDAHGHYVTLCSLLGVLVRQGRSQESLSEERTKEGSVTPPPVGFIQGQSPGWGLGQSPWNPKTMLKIWSNVTNSILLNENIFQR